MIVKVVVALVKNGDKYLIARRNHGDPEANGKWEFPGGKIEENESEFDAVVREMREEFEIEVKPIEYLCNNISEYTARTIELRLYLCEFISGEFKLHAHHEYKWVTLDELTSYDFAPADIPLAEEVVKMENHNV